MMLDMMGSFWVDFGVGYDPKTEDGQERLRLGRLLLGLLHRYGAIEAEFQLIDDKKSAVKVKSLNISTFHGPFAKVLRQASSVAHS